MSCVSRVSPLIAVHARSSALQRAHWKTKADGFGRQRPVPTRTVRPCSGLPTMSGCASESICGRVPATGPTRLANARVDPAESVARTATLSVCPTSFSPSVWLLLSTPRRNLQ